MKLLYEASNFTIQARWVIPFAILGIIGVLLLLCSRKPFFKLLAAVPRPPATAHPAAGGDRRGWGFGVGIGHRACLPPSAAC